MKLAEMNGVLTALITPLDAKGMINKTVLRRIVDHNIQLGVCGLYVCGTTGEGFSLTVKERKEVVEIVCQQAYGRAGVIVNVSHMIYSNVLELARHAHQAGADAVSTLPPLYYPIVSRDVTEYYRSLLDAVDLPLTIYNIPMLSGRALDEAMVCRLLEHERFAGIKHASEDTFLLNRFKQISNGRLMIWNSRDAYYLGGLAMGADGAIGSSYNLMGDLFVKITRMYRLGETEEAKQMQTAVNSVHQRLQIHGALPSIKRSLTLLGFDAGEARLPYQPWNQANDGHLKKTLALLEQTRHMFSINQTQSSQQMNSESVSI